MPTALMISFTLRKVVSPSSFARSSLNSFRYCPGATPISVLNKWFSRDKERFTKFAASLRLCWSLMLKRSKFTTNCTRLSFMEQRTKLPLATVPRSTPGVNGSPVLARTLFLFIAVEEFNEAITVAVLQFESWLIRNPRKHWTVISVLLWMETVNPKRTQVGRETQQFLSALTRRNMYHTLIGVNVFGGAIASRFVRARFVGARETPRLLGGRPRGSFHNRGVKASTALGESLTISRKSALPLKSGWQHSAFVCGSQESWGVTVVSTPSSY